MDEPEAQEAAIASKPWLEEWRGVEDGNCDPAGGEGKRLPMYPVVAVANAPQTLWRILGDRDASD